jgi:hypothetical protein
MSVYSRVRKGDLVQLCERPWHVLASEMVLVTEVDEDGQGFDFVVPEQRGHAPMKFVKYVNGNFDLEKLKIKQS